MTLAGLQLPFKQSHCSPGVVGLSLLLEMIIRDGGSILYDMTLLLKCINCMKVPLLNVTSVITLVRKL